MHHWSDSIFHEAHAHEHQKEHACSDLAEQDPCHRKLVHHDESAGCTHDTHLSAQLNHCLLCSVAPLRHDAWVRDLPDVALYIVKAASVVFDCQESIFSAYRKSNESRGPPALSIA